VNEIYVSRVAHFYHTDLPSLLRNGFLGTEIRAGSTAVAELREYEHMFLEHRDGIIGADLSTFSAVSAFGLIYLRNRDRNYFSFGEGWLEENVVVGFLYIAIQKLYLMLSR
jgi:hypothetical protein